MMGALRKDGTPRAVRKDNVLSSLAPEKQAALFRALGEKQDGVAFCKKEFGLTVSVSMISRWRGPYASKVAALELAEIFAQSKAMTALANESTDLVATDKKLLDATIVKMRLAGVPEEQIKILHQQSVARGHEIAARQNAENSTARVADSAERTRIEKEKLNLLRFKAVEAVKKHADTVRAVMSDTKLSDDEKTAKLGQTIFGDLWEAA